MMNTISEPRYAVYFVPGADTMLYRFGAGVLGYDCYTGLANGLIDGADARVWPGFVGDPAVYGFHATLKPPFYPAKGTSEADIERALLDFASAYPAVPVGELAVRELGSFIALVPVAPRPLLDRLAQACVREFDRFRAAMSEPERARRMTPGLSARQIDHLNRWGYPYVFEDFRFHMTLTGALGLRKRSKALRFLSDKFGQMPGVTSLTVDQIVLLRQANQSAPFRVVRQAALGQSQLRPNAYSF